MADLYIRRFFVKIIGVSLLSMFLGNLLSINIGSTFFVDNSYAVFQAKNGKLPSPPPKDISSLYGEATKASSGVFSEGFISRTIIFLIYLCLYLRFRPLSIYVKTGDSSKKEQARKVFETFFPSLFLAFLALYFFEAVDYLIKAGFQDFFRMVIVYRGFSLVFSCYCAFLILEPLLFMHVAKRMYADEDLFLEKKHIPITIYTRLALMVIFLIVVPFVVIAWNIYNDYFLIYMYKYLCWCMITISLALAIGNMEILYKSIQEPLDGIGKKMGLLASGKFDVKTSVYMNDEIGVLKKNFNIMVDQLRQREEILETFGRYVSIEIARKLVEEKKIDLGGEEIEATVLFCDIRSFTTMSEKMDPGRVVAFLNQYFSFITEPILENRGIINKFIGDAVMAIFTPILGSEKHADDALLTVLGMRKKLEEFNAKKLTDHPIRFGVGLNTGRLIAGNIGTQKRLEYTVIGDVVNISSRIEGQTKNLETDILISKATFDALSPTLRNSLKTEESQPIRLKGKEIPVVLYKIL
ncbi:MAG: adenylate/guanylate cyclase domain-containing protein [Candidatus Riflebacteria bacterium]|nr:adenylate/guanylate cyclase domain-containing protein [Candidatus Riflebacteria bacterium]